jgi:hypothetical protein
MAIFVRDHCPLGVILSLQVTGVISPWSLSITGNEGHYPPGHLNVQVAEAPLFDCSSQSSPMAPPLRSAAEGHEKRNKKPR